MMSGKNEEGEKGKKWEKEGIGEENWGQNAQNIFEGVQQQGTEGMMSRNKGSISGGDKRGGEQESKCYFFYFEIVQMYGNNRGRY